jgi:hypothetical protein
MSMSPVAVLCQKELMPPMKRMLTEREQLPPR